MIISEPTVGPHIPPVGGFGRVKFHYSSGQSPDPALFIWADRGNSRLPLRGTSGQGTHNLRFTRSTSARRKSLRAGDTVYLSRPWELNPQPTVYDTVALPVELGRLIFERVTRIPACLSRGTSGQGTGFLSLPACRIEQDTRIELVFLAWEANVLPLY